MGPDFSPKMAVKSLTSQQIVRIHQLFRQAKFDDPSGDVSIPLLLSQWQCISFLICVIIFPTISFFWFMSCESA